MASESACQPVKSWRISGWTKLAGLYTFKRVSTFTINRIYPRL